MNWYMSALKKYAVFTGRARRKEYWYFVLINFLISVALTFVDAAAGTLNVESGYGVFNTIYLLAVLLPTVALSVRRLHDIDKSAWWLLMAFIPLIGTLILIVFFVLDSKPDENEYGINPKLDEA